MSSDIFDAHPSTLAERPHRLDKVPVELAREHVVCEGNAAVGVPRLSALGYPCRKPLRTRAPESAILYQNALTKKASN